RDPTSSARFRWGSVQSSAPPDPALPAAVLGLRVQSDGFAGLLARSPGCPVHVAPHSPAARAGSGASGRASALLVAALLLLASSRLGMLRSPAGVRLLGLLSGASLLGTLCPLASTP